MKDIESVPKISSLQQAYGFPVCCRGILGEQNEERQRISQVCGETHIARKKRISNHIYFFDWYRNDNQYSKNKVHCSCSMCRGHNMYLDELYLRSFQDDVNDQCRESGEELKVRVPNRFIHFRSHRHSHGWK